MGNIKDPYAELGVPWGTPVDECRRAFKKLARTCHPDLVEGGHEKFCRINDAIRMIESGNIPSQVNVMNYTRKKRGLHHVDLMTFDVI